MVHTRDSGPGHTGAGTPNPGQNWGTKVTSGPGGPWPVLGFTLAQPYLSTAMSFPASQHVFVYVLSISVPRPQLP